MFRAIIANSILLVIHAVAGLLVLTVLAGVAPEFRRMFEEFEVELPAVTVLLIRSSDLMVRYWYAIVPLAALVDFGLLIGLSSLGRRAAALKWGWFSLVLLAALCFMFVALLGLSLPLMQLVRNLG